MFHFVSKLLLNYKPIDSKLIKVRYFETLQSLNQQSLTVSYLTKSCGLPLEKAISATKYVDIESTKKPDSVLELLKAHGFTKSNITRLISSYPRVILADPNKTLKPKIKYFESLGFVRTNLTKLLCPRANVLLCSLSNQIMPAVDFLRGILGSGGDLIRVLPHVLFCNAKKVMEPNASILCDLGVPMGSIRRLIMQSPRILSTRVDLFEEAVNEAIEKGFDPMAKSFILAIRTSSVLSKPKWERKRELLMSFGWSEDEFQSAFRMQPNLMRCSEEKIGVLMGFYVKTLRLEPSDIAKCPNILLASLEKRIIPRCSVLNVLMSKGLIKRNSNFVLIFNMSKSRFEKDFVICHKDHPEVIRAYKGEIEFQG